MSEPFYLMDKEQALPGKALGRGPLHEEVTRLCAKLAQAANTVFPPGFRAKVEMTVDGTGVKAHDVSVSFRPQQPKAGMGEPKVQS